MSLFTPDISAEAVAMPVETGNLKHKPLKTTLPLSMLN